MSAAITAGMPTMIMPAVPSMYQAKIGIVPSVMPGTRVRRMPTMSSTAAATAEISTEPRPSTQTSVLRPGEKVGPVSGGYMNQPPSGATPKKRLENTRIPPRGDGQEARGGGGGEGGARRAR